MSIKLLETEGGGASLEFAAEDVPVVQRRMLERLGSYDAEPWIDGAVISIAGERLLFVNDWDEPCLIGKSASEVALLRTLARHDSRGATSREHH